MRSRWYLAVALIVHLGCTGAPRQEQTSHAQGDVQNSKTAFAGTATKGPISIGIIENWTSELSDLQITLRHPSGASLGLMLVEGLPKADYDDLIANRERFRDLTAKNGNPSINKASGMGLELYEFKSPAGEGYLMITHPPDSVPRTRREITGNTFGDRVILVTGKYEKGDDRARKDIEVMLETIELHAIKK